MNHINPDPLFVEIVHARKYKILKTLHMKIEKSVEIRRAPKEVFDFLRITTNQDKFSVWNMGDPAKKTSTRGTDGTVGFVYGWDSTVKGVGAGEQEITGIDEGRTITYDLRFFKPMKNTAAARFSVTPAGPGSTLVSWSFDSPSKFPMMLFAPIFKKILGKDMEKGLVNLKGLLE